MLPLGLCGSAARALRMSNSEYVCFCCTVAQQVMHVFHLRLFSTVMGSGFESHSKRLLNCLLCTFFVVPQ